MILLSSFEKKAFHRRLNLLHIPTHVYLEKVTNPNYFISVRQKITNFLKEQIKEYRKSYDRKDEKKPISKAFSNLYYKYEPINRNSINIPFILDYGSKNKTSNADLTLMNFESINIVNWLINKLNQNFRYYKFTRTSLHKIFEITLYINTFLFTKHGWMVLMKCNNKHSQHKQRIHAKHRLLSSVQNPFKHMDLGTIQKMRNIFIKKNSCLALEMTSISTYFAKDAYHSKGGFSHILLEIQNNKNINLSESEYIDSVFENLGMLKEHPEKVNKYCSRIVHGLKRICEIIKHVQICDLTKDIVIFINENTEYDDSKLYLPYSEGILSEKKQIRNTPEYDFKSIFDSKKKGFHIPSRKLTISIHEFINSIYKLLLLVEKEIEYKKMQ